MAKIIQFPRIYQEQKREIKSKHQEGDKIYYHGDMANSEGWFQIVNIENNEITGVQYNLEEIDGPRKMTLEEYQISDKYEGHGSTRLVTEKAYNEFKEDQAKHWAKHWAKYMD